MLPYNRNLKQKAQKLRKEATPQENELWYKFLRKNPCVFTRQKTIENYIVDFLCHSKKLVIEIDGSQHYTKDGVEYDNIRTDLLESMELYVIRFKNSEIDNSFDKVCEKIQEYLDSH